MQLGPVGEQESWLLLAQTAGLRNLTQGQGLVAHHEPTHDDVLQ